MQRERLAEILAQELERSEGLPPSAAKHIDDLRHGRHGAALAAAIRAMERAIEESKRG